MNTRTQHLMPTYAPQPVTFSHGKGCYLWDTNGNKYLDALAGIAVTGIGHAHPKLVAAISEQAGQLIHTSNIYHIDHQQTLANKLCELSSMEAVFFSNSGAEANEAAIKLARLAGNNKGFAVPKILVMEGSFHGRTMATLSATGNKKIQKGFSPLLEGFVRVPFNDIDAIKAAAKQYDDIVAVLVEPVQGEGGIQIPDQPYLPAIRELCYQNDWLMMLDEIQTANGRTGKMFAYQHHDFLPDVVTLAKGLANGVPIGACMARDKATDVFAPGSHGSTYGGNPLACRAALEVLTIIDEENLVANAHKQGQTIVGGFKHAFAGLPGVIDIRHSGLLIGIELDRPCAELVKRALDKNILINVTAENVIRLLPPIIITDDEAAMVVTLVSDLITTFLGKS